MFINSKRVDNVIITPGHKEGMKDSQSNSTGSRFFLNVFWILPFQEVSCSLPNPS